MKERDLIIAGIAGGTALLALLITRRASASIVTPSMPIPGTSPAAAGRYTSVRYIPRSADAITLFTSAARGAGVSDTWAQTGNPEGDALHQIVANESNGWVGIPNFHFGPAASTSNAENWPQIWRAIQAGTWRNLVLPQYKDNPSSATGLGQLTSTNIKLTNPDGSFKYYPSGLMGIGVALEEAIGMMKYIKDRYSHPVAALAFGMKSGKWSGY